MKATLWFEMATSSLLCCDPEADVSSGGRCDVAQLTGLSGLMPRSRWYSRENGAPDSHQSPAPSRLSWFLCTGRWRSRPHWMVSRPLRRNPPDCRRCLIASWWPRWRAGPAGAPFPPHLQRHSRWDLRLRWSVRIIWKSEMCLYIPARVGQSGDASYPAIWRVLGIYISNSKITFSYLKVFVEDTTMVFNWHQCNKKAKVCSGLKFAVNGGNVSKFSISIPLKRPWVIQLNRNRVEDARRDN